MNAAEFVAQFQVETSPRVSWPARKPKPALVLVSAVEPEVTAACIPQVAAWLDSAGTLQDAGLLEVRPARLPVRPIVPTLAELYRQERAGLTVSAYHALKAARQRLYELRETFPDQIEDPVKLARFARAQRLTGPKLAAMMPAWLKTWIRNHSAPEPFVFIPNQPPKYPAWTCSCGCPPVRHDMRWNRVLA